MWRRRVASLQLPRFSPSSGSSHRAIRLAAPPPPHVQEGSAASRLLHLSRATTQPSAAAAAASDAAVMTAATAATAGRRGWCAEDAPPGFGFWLAAFCSVVRIHHNSSVVDAVPSLRYTHCRPILCV